uniref:Uncharacterized protein n=1 Tax=Ixodes ricinus TaxID=34613 RepID=A0A6B0UQB7_IXORI
MVYKNTPQSSLRSDKTYRTERAQACKESSYNQPSISHVTAHAHQSPERSAVTLGTKSFKLFMTRLHQYCNVPPPSTSNLLGLGSLFLLCSRAFGKVSRAREKSQRPCPRRSHVLSQQRTAVAMWKSW